MLEPTTEPFESITIMVATAHVLILALAQHGHSLLIYQHFTRQKRGQFLVDRAEQLFSRAGAAGMWAIRTSHVVFFLVSHPAHYKALCEIMGGMKGRLPDILTIRCL
jgi:hypothetical protein